MRPVSARATAQSGCSQANSGEMIRWIVVVFLTLLLFNGVMPWLQKIGLGKLPGDFRFRWRGREWFLPVTTSVILSVIASLISRVI